MLASTDRGVPCHPGRFRRQMALTRSVPVPSLLLFTSGDVRFCSDSADECMRLRVVGCRIGLLYRVAVLDRLCGQSLGTAQLTFFGAPRPGRSLAPSWSPCHFRARTKLVVPPRSLDLSHRLKPLATYHLEALVQPRY